MSTKINTLVIATVLISLTSLSFAFDQPRQGRGGERMTRELNLSPEQQKQFKNIMKEQRASAKIWRQKHQEETRAKLSQVLNEKQMEKLDKMKEQRFEKRKMRKRDR